MDLDAYFAENPMGGSFPTNPDFKSGFVTLVGRPNAGKSTLLNAIMGKKIAITSNTAQTTRHRFRAVHTTDDMQMIIVDTPGLHKPQDALGEELNTSAIKALEDVDVVAMLIDASKPIGRGDEWVAAQVRAAKGSAKICVLSKTDLASDAEISAQREAAEKLCDWDAMVALSAETGRNVDAFVEEVQFLLPEGPAWFPADMETDQPLEVMVAEFIREKILRNFFDEVPHAIGVAVEEMEFEKPNLYRIYAVIYVERDSQKGIIIGKRGAAIKRIGTEARKDLELLLGAKVFLDLSVKVRKNWRRDANQIRRFGYGEGPRRLSSTLADFLGRTSNFVVAGYGGYIQNNRVQFSLSVQSMRRTSMKCPHCSFDNRDDAAFCENCGEVFVAAGARRKCRCLPWWRCPRSCACPTSPRRLPNRRRGPRWPIWSIQCPTAPMSPTCPASSGWSTQVTFRRRPLRPVTRPRSRASTRSTCHAPAATPWDRRRRSCGAATANRRSSRRSFRRCRRRRRPARPRSSCGPRRSACAPKRLRRRSVCAPPRPRPASSGG